MTGGATYLAVLEVASSVWTCVVTGLATYVGGRIINKLKHSRAYDSQISQEEALEAARYRVVLKENTAVDQVQLRQVTATTQEGLTTFMFCFDLPGDTQYNVTSTHTGNLTSSRIQRYPKE